MKRPELSKTLTPEQFQENYYRKEELQTFLKVCKVSASGSKEDLNARILHILQGGTGAIAAGKRAQKSTRTEPLYLDSIIEEDIVCSQDRKSTRLNSSHGYRSRMPSSA